jgi:hypothetical protein
MKLPFRRSNSPQFEIVTGEWEHLSGDGWIWKAFHYIVTCASATVVPDRPKIAPPRHAEEWTSPFTTRPKKQHAFHQSWGLVVGDENWIHWYYQFNVDSVNLCIS